MHGHDMCIDTLLTAFLMIYQSESLEKREIFGGTMPFLQVLLIEF